VEPALGVVPTITAPEQVTLPIYSYLPSVEQTVTLMVTGQNLVNECITTDGGTGRSSWSIMDNATGQTRAASVADVTMSVEFQRRLDAARSGMWGFFDPISVAGNGYRIPADQGNLVLSVPTDLIMEDCYARVDSVTPGGTAAWPFSISSLPEAGPQWRPDDSRYEAVVERWSECMTGRGFDYPTPVDAIAGNSLHGVDEAMATAVATADVGCKIETNLVGVAVAVASAYEQQWIDTHRDELVAQQEQIADYLAGRVTVPDKVPATDIPTALPS
jgi:hypothetical protein